MEQIRWGIIYAEHTVQNTQIDSEDPNELYESGYRSDGTRSEKIPNPDVSRSDPHEDDAKYFMAYKQMFSDGPKLKFVASDKFTGSLFGYIYQMGPKGLGYYIDPWIMKHVYA